MKLAIVAVTETGALLGRKITEQIAGDLYVRKDRHALTGTFQEYTVLKDLVDTSFLRYDGWIFIMAAGIAVRMTAPHIVHKKSDPAVVVLDEKGRHAISLLAGHLGGANALTIRIAGAAGAEPVITTATDINGKIAPDTMAAELGLLPEPFERLKTINAAIVGGAEVDFFVDDRLRDAAFYCEMLQARGIVPQRISLFAQTAVQRLCVYVTDDESVPENPRVLYLRPRRLSVGIGCRKNTSEQELLDALQRACASIGKTIGDVARLASTTVKQEEAGLLSLSGSLHSPINFFDHNTLQAVIDKYHLESSEFVLNRIGVGNVCEAAAIANSQSKKIIVHKTKFPKVTVAIAWEK